MRNLSEVYNECVREVVDAGISIGNITEVKVNNRLTRCWGRCVRHKAYGEISFTIEVSYGMVKDDTPILSLKDTLIHEILHTVDGCCNHGTEWKRCASIVNNKYGYNISRSSSSDEVGIGHNLNTKGEVKKPKYKLICKDCGHEYKYYRMCDKIKYANLYHCGYCDGDLKAISCDDRYELLTTHF